MSKDLCGHETTEDGRNWKPRVRSVIRRLAFRQSLAVTVLLISGPGSRSFIHIYNLTQCIWLSPRRRLTEPTWSQQE